MAAGTRADFALELGVGEVFVALHVGGIKHRLVVDDHARARGKPKPLVAGGMQVGGQAMADRYTYVPLIGIFAAVVWGAADLAAFLRLPAAPFAACRQASTTINSLSLVRFDCNDYSVPVRWARVAREASTRASRRPAALRPASAGNGCADSSTSMRSQASP